MLRGRLLLRYYIIISYLCLGAGMLVSMSWANGDRLALAFIVFVFGLMCHFWKGTFGFYFSIGLNSLGLGLALNVIMEYFEVNFHHEYILFAVGVSLFIYIALVYLASMKWARNTGFYLSFWGMFGLYIVLLVILSEYNNDLTKFLYAIFHLGALYIIAMFYTGAQTELLLRNSSVASFAILAVVIVVAFVALIAQAGGDDLKLGGKSGSKGSTSRRGSYYHRHRYHAGDYLWYSTMYGNGRRRSTYRNHRVPHDETDLERKMRLEREKEEQEEQNRSTRLTEDNIYSDY